jgi:hypothetical protein
LDDDDRQETVERLYDGPYVVSFTPIVKGCLARGEFHTGSVCAGLLFAEEQKDIQTISQPILPSVCA